MILRWLSGFQRIHADSWREYKGTKKKQEIVKEVLKDEPALKSSAKNEEGGTGAARGRRAKPKVPAPPHAQPQRAVLMEVEERWGMGYKNAFANTNKPWLIGHAQKAQTWNKRVGADDGLWEV